MRGKSEMKARMLRGELYLFEGRELEADYARAQELLERYNATRHAEQPVRDERYSGRTGGRRTCRVGAPFVVERIDLARDEREALDLVHRHRVLRRFGRADPDLGEGAIGDVAHRDLAGAGAGWRPRRAFRRSEVGQRGPGTNRGTW